MEYFFKISSQTLWQFLVKIFTSICSFLILGTISRQFGEAGTGDFTLALIYIAFFYFFVDFSFNGHLINNLQDKNFTLLWRKLLGARLIVTAILLISYYLILYTFPIGGSDAFSFNSNFKLAAFFIGINILFHAVVLTCLAIFQAKLKYEYDVLGQIIGSASGVIFIFYLISKNSPIYFLVLGYVLAYFIASMIAILFVKRLVKFISPIFDINFTINLVKQVWPFAATLILNVIYFRVDAFILSTLRPINEVGIYNLSFQVFQAMLVLPTFIMNAFYPIMLTLLRKDYSEFLNYTKKAFMFLLSFSLILSVVCFQLSPQIIKILTGGQGFFGSVQTLQILSLSFPAFFLSSLFMWIFVSQRRYKTLLLIYFLGLIFNLLANLYFIKEYSYLAAAWITVIAEFLILFLQLISIRSALHK